MLAASGIAAIFGRMLSGWCVDRFHGPYVAVCFFILPMIGTALFASGTGGLGPFLGALFCGAALGAEIDLMGFFVSRYFGIKALRQAHRHHVRRLRRLDRHRAVHQQPLFDLYHTYVPAFALYEVLLVVMCLIFVLLGPYPFPAQHRRALEPGKAEVPA